MLRRNARSPAAYRALPGITGHNPVCLSARDVAFPNKVAKKLSGLGADSISAQRRVAYAYLLISAERH